jgi:hypothetical protein
MVTNATNINKTNNYLSPEPTEEKKTTVYDVGNPGPALGHAHKYVGVKLVNGIPTLFS